jgi:primosomal protein N' (replication factor Y)
MAEKPETVDVLLPTVFDRALSYRAPAGLELRPGDLVAAPLGPRLLMGVVWEGEPGAVDASKLRALEGRLDLPPLPKELRHFIDWVATYTLNPRGQVLRAALRGAGEEEPERPRTGYRLTAARPELTTPARERVIAAAAGAAPMTKAALAAAAGVSTGVVDGLEQAGVLEAVPLLSRMAAMPPDPGHRLANLSPAQAEAAEVLRTRVREKSFAVALLDGVTGSGKTNVYLEAVATALQAGRQSLVLVPEIALTEPFLDRFAERFGTRPAAWHAGIQPKLRTRLWNAVARGEAQVVVGARSALFLPFADLGLVVVDEEHDAAYKQEDGIVYHARDMAVVRGSLAAIPVVLASATPSLESRVNADRGRYTRLVLPERHGARPMPRIEAIDLRVDAPARGRFLAEPLAAAVGETLGRGEQALLFLNRRGYAPLTVCRACGHRFGCPNCSAWLVEHRFQSRLLCHHCGHAEPVPHACPKCGTPGKIVPVGPGIERLRDEAASLFPNARMSVLSSDLVGVERMRTELESVARGEIDLVIGTQLVTKGHHFPSLTLVGVVDADLGFSSSDPRAAERTFQVLEQVTGRAGRGERSGRAMLQTYDPNHPVIEAIVSGDREAFYAAEIALREAARLPPFGRLAALIVSGHDRPTAEGYARALARAAPKANEVRVLGPAEAPLAVVRSRHRFRLLAQSPRGFDLSAYMRAWLAAAPPARGSLRVAVDIDPQSFL